MGFREERVARNEVAAREINEAIKETDTRPASSFIHVLCECGLEDCERVLAITRPVYERVRSDPRQFVILPHTAHSPGYSNNRHLLWYATRNFLAAPAPVVS